MFDTEDLNRKISEIDQEVRIRKFEFFYFTKVLGEVSFRSGQF